MFRCFYAALLLLVGNSDILPQVQNHKAAHILYSELSAADISFLKVHALDATISAQLDELFSLPEIQHYLSCIYTGDKGHMYFAKEGMNGQDQEQIDNAYNVLTKAEESIKKAQTVLMEYGFYFVKDHIFTLQQIPGYMFKMALPWDDRSEWLNASRIRFAHKIRAVINKKKLNVKVPNKWAYFVPQSTTCMMPHVIVVAEKMDLSNQQPLSRALWKDIDTITAVTGFSDDHEGNVIGCGQYAVIVDTEERKYSSVKSVALAWQDRLKMQADRLVNDVLAGVYDRGQQIKKLFI